jgi:hypothetical protein
MGHRQKPAAQLTRERPYGRLIRPPERCKRPTLRSLRAAGFPFKLMSRWTKNIEPSIEVDTPGVYIWVLDGVAVYVGESRSIGLRHHHHSRYPGRSRALCHRKLRDALARGERVAIYGIKDPMAKWNGMNLPIRKAVEHTLLLEWAFAWNRAGQGRSQ